MDGLPVLNYSERLHTFDGFWDDNLATANQLAAIGHVYDRPPLEALEEGSRCMLCSMFVRRELSVRALEGPISSSHSYAEGFESFTFHHPSCDRLQVRIPLEPQALLGGLYGFRMHDMRKRFEPIQFDHPISSHPRQHLQTSSFFTLPLELRLEIYALILPSLTPIQEIVPLNNDSSRIVTTQGCTKTGPRDLTKPNLLRTCRAVHAEALDLLFTTTTYRFASSKVLYLFLRHIGRPGRERLRSIDVQCGSREDAISFALLASCTKLRAITIRLGRPRILFPRAPPWCVDGMAALLALSGLEEVRFGDCGPKVRYYLDESKADAEVVRKEVMRPQGAEGAVRWVDGYLDV